MSKVTKRKHVMKEMQTDDFDPPASNQQIVRILSSRGNNLHEVEGSDNDEKFLVSMPTKFRKNVWVKRGDFIIVEPIEEGDKVKAEIIRILTPQHIKEFTKDGIWPPKFVTNNDRNGHKERKGDNESGESSTNCSDNDDDDLFKNTNRNQQMIESSSSESESSDGDEADESSEGDDENDIDRKTPKLK